MPIDYTPIYELQDLLIELISDYGDDAYYSEIDGRDQEEFQSYVRNIQRWFGDVAHRLDNMTREGNTLGELSEFLEASV